MKNTKLEIQENIIAEINDKKITITKSVHPTIFALLFIGLTVFIGAIVGFIIQGEILFMVFAFIYIIVSVFSFIKKIVIINLKSESYQITYFLWKYKLIESKNMNYSGKHFFIQYKTGTGHSFWYELRIENSFILKLTDSNSVENLLKITKGHLSINPPKYHVWRL